MMKAEGGCLCGKTRYVIDGEPMWAGDCYCLDCQKESGAGHLTGLAVPGDAFTISGPVKTYSAPGGSGTMIDRSFCGECGSTLVSHPHVMGDGRIVRVGTLDDASAIEVNMAVFCTRAQHWDQPAGGRVTFDEMPPMG